MKIGVIVAMDKELQQLQHLFDNNHVIVEKCGIGKVNAAIGTTEMIRRHRPDVIISSGCAGGNGDDINVQDVVVGREIAYHDVYCGTAIDGSTVYGQVQGMPARFQADGKFPEAKAVDMESAAIAQTCHIFNIPFISFRIISDIPLRDTDASMYHNFWSTIAENSFQITRNFIESL